MREILFRGKSVDSEKWVYGGYFKTDNEHYIITNTDGLIVFSLWDYADFVIPESIGQYVGLCDKNGKKIFEGDIVTMPSYHGGKHKTVVYFKNGKFAVDGSNYSFKDIAPRNMEVIGNIHDNPELVK